MFHFPGNRRDKQKKSIISQCHAFVKNENNVCKTGSLKLKLNLPDNTPFKNPYRSIPKHLYSEVKHYMEDLVTDQWSLKSQSS